MIEEYQDEFLNKVLNDFAISRVVYDLKRDLLYQYHNESSPLSLPIYNFSTNIIKNELSKSNTTSYAKFIDDLSKGISEIHTNLNLKKSDNNYSFFEINAYKLQGANKYLLYLRNNDQNRDYELRNVDDDLRFDKYTLYFALKQSAVNYFEFDFLSKEIHLSKFCASYFNLKLNLRNYHNWLLNTDIIYEDDKELYYKEISKIASGEKINSSFEARFMVNGEFKWHRLNATSIQNEQGQVIKSLCIVTVIEEELMNRFRYDIELDNLLQFDNKYLAFILIDLENYQIISSKSNAFKLENNFLGNKLEMYLSEVEKELFNYQEFQALKAFLSKDNLFSGKEDKLVYKCRRKCYNDLFIWVENRVRYLNNPYNDHQLCIIEIYDINQSVEEKKLLKTLIGEENEVVYRADMDSEQVVVFAKEGNKLAVESGMYLITFKQFDLHFSKTLTNYKLTNLDDDFLPINEYFEIMTKNSRKDYLFESRDDEFKEFFRVNLFLDDNRNLFLYIDDVTSIIEKERKITDNLEVAIYEAKVAKESKDAFFARMSHDMRTPMTAILAMADFALEEVRSVKVENYIKQIINSSNYLLALLNDILELQRSEKVSLTSNPRVHDAELFFESTAKMIEVSAQDKNIDFTYNTPLIKSCKYLIFDEIRLRQMYLNLLNNAIKYTPENGVIVWDLESYKKGDKIFLRNIIKDNGIGMSEDFQKIMFDQFSRESSDFSQKDPGTGLGLAIVKSLVDSWSGTITCKSEVGKGTSFVIEFNLPIANSSEIENYLASYQEMNINLDFSSKKVLIVEDVSINARIITRLLNEKNIKSFWVNNGLKAVKEVKDGSYDLIIMDIKMPVLNGLEASKRIREFNDVIPIIALSANAFDEDIQISKEYGIDDYLSKPIDKLALYQSLKKYLKF